MLVFDRARQFNQCGTVSPVDTVGIRGGGTRVLFDTRLGYVDRAEAPLSVGHAGEIQINFASVHACT